MTYMPYENGVNFVDDFIHKVFAFCGALIFANNTNKNISQILQIIFLEVFQSLWKILENFINLPLQNNFQRIIFFAKLIFQYVANDIPICLELDFLLSQ